AEIQRCRLCSTAPRRSQRIYETGQIPGIEVAPEDVRQANSSDPRGSHAISKGCAPSNRRADSQPIPTRPEMRLGDLSCECNLSYPAIDGINRFAGTIVPCPGQVKRPDSTVRQPPFIEPWRQSGMTRCFMQRSVLHWSRGQFSLATTSRG
ncbi:MAG: hypothetical protein JWN70_5084, partial [Planctomycetaceae bacterium]|nr:hypothetical protein [Planctomycetaceae bacterium]